MATAKLPLLLLTLSLLAAAAAAASASAPAEDAVAGETPLAKEAHSQLRAELEQLRSKIFALESSISDRTRDLEGKDDKIAQLEKTLLEKTAIIVSLQGEVELSQTFLAEQTGPTRVPFMRSPPPKQLEKKNEEQTLIIQKTERALIVAEEELMRTQLEATSKSTESIKVHGAWLPPWLANLLCHFQDLAVIHWNEDGKPALNLFLEKASEKSAQVQELTKPHLETIKTKVSESAKPHIDKISSFTKPHVEIVRAVLKPYTEHLAHAYGEFLKSAMLFHQQVHGAWLPPWLANFICHFQDLAVIHWNEHGKPAVNLFLEKASEKSAQVQELAKPHLETIKTKVSESAKPHIDKISSFTKPHVEKVRAVLKSYTEHLAHAYGEFLKSATLYHQQAEGLIQEKLKKHELTNSLATKELVWFMASALLALPVFVLYRILCVMFCKKSRKRTMSANVKNTS